MTSRLPEDVFISLLRSTYRDVPHRAHTKSSPSTSRQLSSLVARTTINPPIIQRLACTRLERLTRARARTFATYRARNAKSREIAVLGGGITGLTAAHYLARHAPDARITLYESSARLGGWIDGRLAKTGDGQYDQVLLQHGPRLLRSGRGSLKFDDLVFYDVLGNLPSLNERLMGGHHFYTDRYLYYPDHLVRLPPNNLTLEDIFGMIKSFLTEPLWNGAIPSLINFIRFRISEARRRHEDLDKLSLDESVGDYLGKMLGDDRLVKNIFSGIMHGVYGGDIYKLSVKHTFFADLQRGIACPLPPGVSWTEVKDVALLNDMLGSPNIPTIRKLAQQALGSAVLTFPDGLLSLASGLERDLQAQNNVRVKTNSRVTSLSHKDDKVLVTTANEPGRAKQYDKVICTLFSKHLAELVEPKGLLPSLADTHAVTIMVVNLWFRNPRLLDRNPGFGYLVPQSTPDNDEWVLGVLFDSYLSSRDEPDGTKLTVMLGGRYWDGWRRYPDEETAKQLALEAVQRHLRISPDEEVVAAAQLCRDCLPQHYVGHRNRMKDAHYDLLTTFKGQLSVAGPSYTTIGVIPAMRAGFDAAMRVAYGRGPFYYRRDEDPEKIHSEAWKFKDHIGETGLETFTERESDTMIPVVKESLAFRHWSAGNGKTEERETGN
ncbi:Protoporphyrinogen oxidase [Hypoxylon sp. FL0543]|nr:Protoporphyrinogen oxidase [Hypoxylon sp. FL0543]